MNAPTISVVMSVFNSEKSLNETIESVLAQSYRDFELIVIDDGSSDNSADIAEQLKTQDSRIKLVRQENQGLTKALINGCNIARGEFIARQDAGDISLELRFESQLALFKQEPNLVMVSTGTTFVTPNIEELYTTIQSDEEASIGLRRLDADKVRGPSHHGSVMFKRDTYQKVGGYRAPFSVAQDLDLWTRLIEHGEHKSTTDVHYRAIVEKSSISFLKRNLQLEMTEIILKCAAARKTSGSDKTVLAEIKDIKRPEVKANSKSDAAYYYFLASNLIDKDHKAGYKYLKKAIAANPFHLKARVKLIVLTVTHSFR